MTRFSYLTRRQGGVYYLQIRLPQAVRPGTKLARFSLFTRDYRQARTAVLAHLAWLIPMKDAADTAELIEYLCDQLDEFLISLHATDLNDVRSRISFLKRLLGYIADWQQTESTADFRDYRLISKHVVRLREGAAILNLLLLRDMAKYRLRSYDEGLFTHWTPRQIAEVLGARWYEDDIPEDGPDDDDDADPEADERIPVPGDSRHFDGMAIIGNSGTHADIVKGYIAHYRPDRIPHLPVDGEDKPFTLGQWKAENRLMGYPPLWAETPETSSGDSAAVRQFNDAAALPANDPETAVEPKPASPQPERTGDQIGAQATAVPQPTGGITLSQAKKEFLDYQEKRFGDARADEDTGLVINFLIDFAGDRPLSSLNREIFRTFERALADTPNRTGIPRKQAGSLMARYLYAKANGWDGLRPISKKRFGVWHLSLNQFFAWLIEQELYSGPQYKFKLVPDNAAESEDRDAWTNAELKTLFSLPLFTGAESADHFWTPGNTFVQSELYWAYVLIFFTGMRNSEIAVLRVHDIIKGEDGLDYFDLTGKQDKTSQDKTSQDKSSVPKKRGKTRNARRLIPIPRLIIDLGLLERKADLEAAGVERLFPEWHIYKHPTSGRLMPGHHFSKSWQYIKKKFGFNRSELTIYGGRHTKATWLDAKGIPDRIRDRIMGHAPKSVAGKYGAKQLTTEEAKLVQSKEELPIEQQIGKILVTPKLRAEHGALEIVKTWVGSQMSHAA